MKYLLLVSCAFAIALGWWVQTARVTAVGDGVTLVTLAGDVAIVAKQGKPATITRLPPKTPTPPKPGAAWTLPYSCDTARSYAARFSRETLEAMRKQAGMAEPTPAQKRQIAACLAGKS